MNAVANISRKSLKTFRGRNILIVLTIILSTTLLTSIAVLSNSIQKSLLNDAVRYFGRYHGIYDNLTDNQLEILSNHQRIGKSGEWITLGYAQSMDPNEMPYIMMYMDSSAAQMMNIKILKGSLPKAQNEIALDERTIEKLGGKPEIGEKINIRFNTAVNGVEDEIQEGDFIISGILEMDRTSSCPIVVSREAINSNTKYQALPKSLYVMLKDKSNIESKIVEIGRKIGLEDNNIHPNTAYIKSSGGDVGVVVPFVLIGLLVVIASGVVIYNIFHISIVERIQQFGLLLALGATKKQIKSIIIREGMILSIVGIPGGIVLGHLLGFGIIPMLSIESLTVKTSISIIVVSILVSLGAVMASLIKPGRYAAKISPVEAIRYSGAEVKTKKKERQSTISVNVKRMAYLNLWRNKKRTLMTLLSLTMAGILFMVFSTLLASMNIDNLVNSYIQYDFQLAIEREAFYRGGDPLDEEVMSKMQSLEGVKEISWLKNRSISILEENPQGQELLSSLYAYDEDRLMSFEKDMIEGKLSLEDLKNKNKVLLAYGNGYKVGDKITFNVYNQNTKQATIAEVTVAGIIGDNNGKISRGGMGPTLVAHGETFTRITAEQRISHIFIDADNGQYDNVDKAIKEIISNNQDLVYESRGSFRQKALGQYRGLQAAAMSMVSIIALIGMINLINTMITSILSRRKELGMLQAVGLSNSQLRRMLQIEGLYFAAISSIFSIVIGTVLGYGAFMLLKKAGADYAQYQFPLVPLILVILVFTALQITVTLLVEKNIKKDSIIERLRYNG